MQEKYRTFVKSALLESKNIAELFIQFVRHFSIKELKKIPDFNRIKEMVIALNLNPQTIFDKVAIYAVKEGNLATLKFLIDECRYDLKNTKDMDHITLLHEACLRGEVTIVQYFLEKNFDPNVKDSFQEAPLHAAIKGPNQEKVSEIITVLHQHKGHLNDKEQNGLPPLHLAALYKNDKAAVTLVKLGANRKILSNEGDSYIQFKKKIEAGNIENNTPPADFSIPKKSFVEEAFIQYYRGIFSLKFNIAIFHESRSWFLKKPTQLTLAESRALTDALVLTSSFAPFEWQKITSTLSNLVEKNQLSHLDLLLSVLSISRFFSLEYEAEICMSLNQFVIDYLEKMPLPKNKIFDIFYVLGVIYKEINQFKKAEYFLTQASSMVEDRLSTEKSDTFYNLGFVQECLGKYQESFQNFKKAFYCTSNDVDIFHKYCAILLINEVYDELLKITQTSPFVEYAMLMLAAAKLFSGRLSYVEVLKLANGNFSLEAAQKLALELKMHCLEKLGNYEEVFSLVNHYLESAEKAFEKNREITIEKSVLIVLGFYMRGGRLEKALEIAKASFKKYPHHFERNALVLGKMATLFAFFGKSDQSNQVIEKLKTIGIDPIVLSGIYYALAINVLASEKEINYSIALNYLDLSLVENPKNTSAYLQKLIIFVLRQEQENAIKILEHLNQECGIDQHAIAHLQKYVIPVATTEIEADVGIGDEASDLLKDLVTKSTTEIVPDADQAKNDEESESTEIEIECESYDPIKIRNFWKTEKERLFKETADKLSCMPEPKTKWHVASTVFEEGKEGVVEIFHPQYANCYAVIHPKLDLDSKLKEKCQSVLKKERDETESSTSEENTQPDKRKRKQGVQTLNNAVTQLKIAKKYGGKRLWTDKVYCMNGKYLFVFDRCDDHKAIKRKAQKPNTLKVIQLKDLPNTLPLPSGVFSTEPVVHLSSTSSATTTTTTMPTTTSTHSVSSHKVVIANPRNS